MRKNAGFRHEIATSSSSLVKEGPAGRHTSRHLPEARRRAGVGDALDQLAMIGGDSRLDLQRDRMGRSSRWDVASWTAAEPTDRCRRTTRDAPAFRDDRVRPPAAIHASFTCGKPTDGQTAKAEREHTPAVHHAAGAGRARFEAS
jgi:hypothetical protein